MNERGQSMAILAVFLSVAAVLLALVVVNLGWYAAEIAALREIAQTAATDGALQVMTRSDGVVRLDPPRAEAVARETLNSNLSNNGFTAEAIDVYVETNDACGLTNPLGGGGTYCGPFVAVRMRVPLHAVLGGYTITPTILGIAEVGRVARGQNVPMGTLPTPTPETLPPVVPIP